MTIYDPVDTVAFALVNEQQKLQAKLDSGLCPQSLTVLMVARFERRKRHDLLVKAFAKVGNRGVQLVFVGESNGDLAYEREIESLIQTCNLANQVVIKGFQENIRSIESAADIAVLCSEDEPLGMFILESMALGVPVIVSDDGGLAEIVGDDRRAGLIQRRGDSEHLAECLLWMIRHPNERHEMGIIGRERCIKKCGMANPGLEHLFDELLERKDLAPSRSSRPASMSSAV